MEKPNTNTEAGAIAALAMAASAAAPQIMETKDGREYLVVPNASGGYTHTDLTPKNSISDVLPGYITQKVTLQTVDALGEYLLRFREEDTILLGDVFANRIVGLIDYHGPGQAHRSAHVADLILPFSTEYRAWTSIDGVFLGQLEFARWIEENSIDIKAPSGADLLEVCRDLQAKRKVSFKSAVRTASDNESFEYVDETGVTVKDGSIDLPTQFLLSFPIYFGDARQDVAAFLRWKFEEGKLLLGIQLHRLENVKQAIFQQHLLTLAERVERPGYLGKI